MTTQITGTHVRKVTRQVLDIAGSGDFRAIRVTLLGQPGVLHDRIGIVTPHRNASGELDSDDLAAQVWAIAFDEQSDTGTYTDGYYSSGGTVHWITAASAYFD